MRALTAAELLSVWERGLARTPAERALLLLAAAHPDTPLEALAELSIGRRDAQLLTLREWCFGSPIACVVTCPNCGEQLELAFDVADIRAEPGSEPGRALHVEHDGYAVDARLPNSRDLAAVAALRDGGSGRAVLLARCLLAARYGDREVAAGQLPPGVVDALAARMAEADPMADVRLALACPACDRRWHAVFDIMAYFWSEINTWARRVLAEVHRLASAYGWSEADILAMSPLRRQLYLEMIGG